MAKEINYTDGLSNALIQLFLQGNGNSTSTTTTTGGGLDPATMASLQALMGGLGAGIGAPGAVSAPTVPSVSPEITPEQLAAIFQQGAQEVPTLTAAFANAAGARSGNNSGLMLALNTLNESLVREAAKLKQGQQALSTDAAYKGGSLGMQAAEINARNQQAYMQMMGQLQAQRLQAATQIAGYNRQPETKITQTDKEGAVDPMKLLFGGMALNYADKAGVGKKIGSWWDNLWGGEKASTTSDMLMPSQDYSLLGGMTPAPQIDSIGMSMGMPQSHNWNLAPIEISMPEYQTPNYNFGGFSDAGSNYAIPDFGGSYDWSIPSFDFDFGSMFGSDDNWVNQDYNYDNFFGDGFFADGGMPMRRNQANMGAAPTRTLQGVQNRTLPSQYQQLVAPIDIQLPQAPQMPRMSLQQMMPQGTEPFQQPTIAARPQVQEEMGEGSNDSMENNMNQNFDPGVASAVKNGLGLVGLLSSFGAAPALAAGLGLVSPMARATTNEDAAAAAATGAVRLANPVLGFIAQQVNRIREERAAEERAKAEAEALAQHQRDVANAETAPTTATTTTAAVQLPTTTLPGTGNYGRNDPVSDGGYGREATDPEGYGNMGGGYGDHSGGDYGGDSDSDSDSGSGSTRSTYRNGGMPMRGGMLHGPGTGTSDSIAMPMANVSNGEYIVSADVVNAVGPQFFDALQAAFHKGGKPA